MTKPTTIAVRVRPFTVPNFVQYGESGATRASNTIAVSDVDRTTLDQMAADWLDALYAKAGRTSPWVK